MGGKAFAGDDPNLLFPRLSPRLYKQLKDEMTTRLLKHFERARVPIETPEKTSHGDIDVLVCNPVSPDACDPATLSFAMCARLWKQVKGSDTVNLAFDWPEGESDFPPASTTPSTNTQSKSVLTTKRYLFQVDVHICAGPKSLDWMLFGYTHGDLWNVLGSIIRPFGLIRNQHGLLIVIAEFAERAGGGGLPKYLQRVLLTDDPSSTLDFLGLDSTQYWKPFESVDQMFDFLVGCRFYMTWGERAREIGQEEEAGGEQRREPDSSDVTSHSGRRRTNQRLIFHRWLTDYIPTHPPRPYCSTLLPATPTADCLNTDSSVPLATERIVDTTQAAKAFFGAGFANRYSTARDRSLLILGAPRLWADIRHLLTAKKGAEGAELGYAMKGLKRCVQPEGFEAWVQAVLARGECESLEPTACPSDSLFSAGLLASGDRRDGDGDGDGDGDRDGNRREIPETTEENIAQKVRDFLGFYVPGIPIVRRHFQAREFDRVKKWVFGGEDGNGNGNDNDNDKDSDSMWKLVSKLQKEKDMVDSSKRTRKKEEK